MKRLFDIIGATFGLLLFSPVFLVIALLIKLDSRGPVFFTQERVGKGFKRFFIYKFRTMTQEQSNVRLQLTVGDDPRITRVGRLLRKTKVDELSQLINVLKGDMSFVGPRPEVPRFVELFHSDYEQILTVRPGITDLASLKYRDEAAILAKADNPEAEYVSHVLPDKIRLAKDYIQQSSFLFDLSLILRTIIKLFDNRLSSPTVA
jgi:lipopolysaccharide/colanic/teichoic acid biosynthesis glycosyltransferase